MTESVHERAGEMGSTPARRARRSIVAVVSSVCAIAVFAACAETVKPEPTPTASAEPTASATPSPAPTPTAVAMDPSDVTTWVISDEGIGPIERGASYPDGVASLAAYVSDEICPGTVTFSRDGTSGVLVSLSEDGTRIMTVWVSGRADAEGVVPTSPATASGIRIGSSAEEFAAAYPGLEPIVQIAETTWGYAVGDDASGWVDFIVDDDVVLTIGSSERARAPREFCG